MAASRILARAALFGTVSAALLGSASSALAAPCQQAAANKCTTGVGELKAEIKTTPGDVIDSGWMDKGQIKVRAKFQLAPVGTEPFVKVTMPASALVEATWTEKGYVDVKPLEGAAGKMDVRYTLLPALEASIYGISVNYNANELLNRVQGASFKYDVKASGAVPAWGLDPGTLVTPGPALAQSTIYAMPFSQMSVDSGIATGTLAIQAATSPTFTFKANEVSFGPASAKAKNAPARVIVGDQDALDLSVVIRGEVSYAGQLAVKPNVVVDSVAGYPTFGLTKFSFDAVSKDYKGAPIAVSSNTVNVHIPLPNVKVPTTGISLGDVKSGGKATKKITVQNTGEMEGVFSVTSSDPAFKVSGGEVKIAPKGTADVEVSFDSSGGASSATLTFKTNDPDSPEQTLKIGANGADVSSDDDDGEGGRGGRVGGVDPTAEMQDSGCSVATPRSGRTNAFSAVALGLALAALARLTRRRGA